MNYIGQLSWNLDMCRVIAENGPVEHREDLTLPATELVNKMAERHLKLLQGCQSLLCLLSEDTISKNDPHYERIKVSVANIKFLIGDSKWLSDRM